MINDYRPKVFCVLFLTNIVKIIPVVQTGKPLSRFDNPSPLALTDQILIPYSF